MADQDIISLKNGNSSAEVHLFGATLISWKVDNNQHLFVSKKSLFNNQKAIRGGVPFVFPQFGPWGSKPQHGFARTSKWSICRKQSGSNHVMLMLKDNDKTREIWKFPFRIEYLITLGETDIEMNVKVINTGEDNMAFTLLLHTYFSVPDVLLCSVTGFEGCRFIDKVRKNISFTEDRDEIKVAEFTDRIYQNTPMKHTLSHVAGDKTIEIEKHNFPDTVVWNPWIESSKQMSDFGDEEWKSMLCVEPGFVIEPITLEPTQEFSAGQKLAVKNLENK